jgi:hypothetical protein
MDDTRRYVVPLYAAAPDILCDCVTKAAVYCTQERGSFSVLLICGNVPAAPPAPTFGGSFCIIFFCDVFYSKRPNTLCNARKIYRSVTIGALHDTRPEEGLNLCSRFANMRNTASQEARSVSIK